MESFAPTVPENDTSDTKAYAYTDYPGKQFELFSVAPENIANAPYEFIK